MAAVVVIDDGHGLRFEAYCINNLIRVNYRCISCYFFNISFLNNCTQATRRNSLVIKVSVVCTEVGVSRHLKEDLAWAIDKGLQVIGNKMSLQLAIPLRKFRIKPF